MRSLLTRKLCGGFLVSLSPVLAAGIAPSQQSVPPGGSAHFAFASIREDRGDAEPETNVPLTANDFYPPNGGRFNATNMDLMNLIAFAYKLPAYEEHALADQMPVWAREMHVDLHAGADNAPGKDEMRAMMRNLLAERFQLAIQTEQRVVPVYRLVVRRPGQLGPSMKLHTGDRCGAQGNGASPAKPNEGPPSVCDGANFAPPQTPGDRRVAGQVTMRTMAEMVMGLGTLGRPVIDATGLSGIYDFSLEWAPDKPGATGPGFQTAVPEELGLELRPDKAPASMPVLDRIEKLSAE